MPKLYSSRETIKTFQRAGFNKITQKGSHLKMRGFWNSKLQTIIIPVHKQIAFGTFQSILNQSGMSKSEFEQFLK
ncbi:MAG TPA: type II toxin-antitoxin system HicA family toxin [Alphaproteobacteria bacterium]|jgi:predicted RNA binding protein YcfA (HicA-like mRNA interferase family)|nr:type II toxin-antitoxin system HicA family toxin [Alphaproteobacteria bacterium]